MEFALLFTVPRGTDVHDPEAMVEMGKLSAELADRKVLRRGFPLEDEGRAVCVRLRDGAPVLMDGPFAESKEVIAGTWIVDVPDRAAALEIARRSPHARRGRVLVHRLSHREAFPDPGEAKGFLLVFRDAPGVRDPDGAKLREMMEFARERAREGSVFEIGKLDGREPTARVEPRIGEPLVTDGPYAETAEVIAGYALARATDAAAALALAQRFPHARWAPVEVREVLFFDRVS
jgi:hypothetical protein